MERWLQQAEASARDYQTPMVHLHIIGTRHHNDIVMLRAQDLHKLLEEQDEILHQAKGTLEDTEEV
jgi:hypothetical protein